MNRIWTERPGSDAPTDIDSWAQRLEISPLIARLLWQRGLTTPSEMDVFLSPGLRNLAAPETLPGLSDAAQVLAEGLNEGKQFCVWGDYDVDGVTSTALVTSFMNARGIKASHHIPNRLEHGYGMNLDGIEQLAAQGVKLLLTVDCGITSHEEIARANELGITVVVSDHHLPGEKGLPPASAVTNPRLGDCPCPDLAGVGVAFLLMAAVNRLLPGQAVDMRQYLDLVALGTIADVVRLTGQNRILVKNGLLLVTEASRPGIAALKEASGYAPSAALGAGQVGFGLAPRINASGRLGDAEAAFKLLLAPDYETARPFAQQLDALNADRRGQEDTILKEAKKQAEGQLDNLGLVLHAPGWHPGVIGIVASRIVEAYYRPTLILAEEGDLLKGSGRSTREFDLHAGLTSCADLLAGFGGHKQAAGMSLEKSNLDALRTAFHQAVLDQCGDKPLTATLFIDGELPFSDIDFDLLKELEMLQPFGPGNAEPVFSSPPVKVTDRRTFGKDHVKLKLTDEVSGMTLNAKAWRQAEAIGPDIRGKQIRIAYTPKIDRYQGMATIDLLIKDWKVERS
ncbi:single-stranded-DNA-specific exonuclease RecJ [Desulfovibrio ferrophilus]|uniref:Single-stranded-DNA-specific exonuclease RecJ n=1 Tax=Desulfovibrio ferrophilus TaxID=241368 RepID=A0A2Z6AV78_9BACT|nr:single-stranded-DNA-specific exonuclease RecJ [Desulfovibrio ferrophilus]BBD07149.1 single-stranded-DNA-specific exonuclease RecJ [Desulfovibrio ferrophilus]